MHGGAWATALALLLLSGCLGTPATVTPEPRTPATLEAAPEWAVGDWWRLEIEDPITATTFEVTQVVAAVTETHYILGFPADEWNDAALLLHVPAYGEIERDTLGWEVHDEPFQPLRFPLVAGEGWDTRFEGLDMHAEITAVDATTATLSLVAAGLSVEMVYDTTLRTIGRFTSADYASFQVIDHGSDWNTTVIAPLGMDLVFLHGRVVGALDLAMQPAAPIESVEVADGYDRISFAALLGPILLPGAPGAYRERITDPQGQVYSALVVPGPNSRGLLAFVFATNDPAGTWSFEHIALGPGAAAVEGIAYRTETYALGGAAAEPNGTAPDAAPEAFSAPRGSPPAGPHA